MQIERVLILLLFVSIVLTPVRLVLSRLLPLVALLFSLSSNASTCVSFYRSVGTKSESKPTDKAEAKAQFPHRKFKSGLPGKPRISLTRFEGFSSFEARYSGVYLTSESSFSFDGSPMHSGRVGFGKDETFLNELQQFPLGKMTETDYITAAEAKVFNKLGTSLEPSQVNFFEVTREATREQWAAYPPELLANRWDNLSTFTGKQAPDVASIRTATLWSVGGQVLDVKLGLSRPVQLPWEKEEARKGQSLDRTKYKYVWEWGRAAQDIAEEVSPVYSGNAALNYIDLVMSGGSLKDGHVMFHSFDPINTRYYLSEHPGSTYPPDAKNKSDMLFLVPLKDMLKRYPPSRFSKHVDQIIKISGSKISEVDALDILINVRLLQWDELNVTGRVRQRVPVILNDASSGRLLGLHIMLNKFGLEKDQVVALMDYLVAIRPVLHTANTGNKYEHAADSIATMFTYHDKNAVEISNIDPQLAARDPRYVQSMIFNAYMVYVNRLSKLIEATYGLPSMEAKQQAIQLLINHDVKFGVTTAAPEVQKQSELLKPVGRSSQPKVDTIGVAVDAELMKTQPYLYKDSKIYFYSLSQIMSWARENSAMLLDGSYELNPGFWRQQYFKSQVDLL